MVDDSYDNLILLCPTCHKIVDDQPAKYTVGMLREMKREHEERTFEVPRHEPYTWGLAGTEKPVRLDWLASGDQVVRLIRSKHSYTPDKPDGLSRDERELVGSFLQDCDDWGEVLPEQGPRAEADAANDFDEHIARLRECGLVVLGGTRRLTLVTSRGNDPGWIDVVLKIMRVADFLAFLKSVIPESESGEGESLNT